MKKLLLTKERYNKSDFFQKKYGKLKYVNESGKIYKTDKGNIIKLISEAREYIDDTSIDADSAEEFIIFDDPEILTKIAEVQNKEGKKAEQEIKQDDVTKQDVAQAAQKGVDKKGSGGQIASAAISTAGNIVTNPNVLATIAGLWGLHKAKQGYDKVKDEMENLGDKAGQKYADWMGWNDNMNAGIEANAKLKAAQQTSLANLAQYAKDNGSNLGTSQSDKRAMYIAKQLMSGGKIKGGKGDISADQAKEWLTKNGYEINQQGVVNKVSDTAKTAATGAAASTGTTLFGMSLSTIGWIAAGAAAAAIITPYIYDKVRACTKTWMADIIAEVKFKADGKNYRCFYDLKKNKWVLTYADIKWTSYLDNKLDKETIEEFFNSEFFSNFLGKCNKAFAMLFSFNRNEATFKAIPEIKDAPKELKEIINKIYDNKGAITRNLFSGTHE